MWYLVLSFFSPLRYNPLPSFLWFKSPNSYCDYKSSFLKQFVSFNSVKSITLFLMNWFKNMSSHYFYINRHKILSRSFLRRSSCWTWTLLATFIAIMKFPSIGFLTTQGNYNCICYFYIFFSFFSVQTNKYLSYYCQNYIQMSLFHSQISLNMTVKVVLYVFCINVWQNYCQ